jgi:hypothetical protein
MATKIPLVDKTLGEILESQRRNWFSRTLGEPARGRSPAFRQPTEDGDFKTFT